MSSKMGSIWENYDLSAEVGMENKDIVNMKIDGRVLLSVASDTKIEFVSWTCNAKIHLSLVKEAMRNHPARLVDVTFVVSRRLTNALCVA